MIFPKIIYCFIKQYIEIKCYIKKLNRERYKKNIIYYYIYIINNFRIYTFHQFIMQNIKISKYITNLKHLTYKIVFTQETFHVSTNKNSKK